MVNKMNSTMLSWFDNIQINNTSSVEILLALIESKDALVRSDAISRLSDFDQIYFTERVLSYIINIATKDVDKACRSSAYDFMSAHPNKSFHKILSTELNDRHTWVQRSFVYAVYSNFEDNSENSMEKMSRMINKPAMAAAALVCLTYIRREFQWEIIRYLKSRDFLIKLDVVRSLYECVEIDGKSEVRAEIIREIKKQLKYEVKGLIHEELKILREKIELC
jgi:hypothetical protein